jgi:hypothetical protein
MHTRPPCRRWAQGLRADRAAVQAAVPGHWNPGPREGPHTRVTRRTRPLCGRARRDLLARRFCLAAEPGPGQPPWQARADTRMAAAPCLTNTGQEPDIVQSRGEDPRIHHLTNNHRHFELIEGFRLMSL